MGVVGEAFASAGVLSDYAVLGYGGHGSEENGEGFGSAKAGKDCGEGYGAEARLLYRLMSML